MDHLLVNKVFGAVTAAGMLALVCGLIAEALVEPHELEEPAYAIAGGEAGETQEAAAEAPAETEDLPTLLAAADPAAGEKVAKKCASCHSFDNGGPNKVGPNLWGVVGRNMGTHEGFNYSSAMAGRSGDTWTYENLNHFLTRPRDFVEGTKMTFAGIRSPEDRANLLAYLRTLSDSPVPLP
jgi:cytochrome c